MTIPSPILVTGGAGFLGGHLVPRLQAAGAEVRVLDDLSGAKGRPPPSGTMVVDVRDETRTTEAFRGCAAVVHLADRPVPPDLAREGFYVNVLGTLAVLQAARTAGIPRLVLASSCSVYGATAPPQSETRAPSPVSLVGASKVGSEAIARSFAERGEVDVVALRFFHVYGKGRAQSPVPGVLAQFGQAVARGEPPRVHGSGEATRDFVHVDDAVGAIRLALERRVAAWTLANVGTGVATCIRSAAEAVCSALGRIDLEPVSVDPPPGPVVSAFADTRVARTALGFEAKVSLAEGLARRDFYL